MTTANSETRLPAKSGLPSKIEPIDMESRVGVLRKIVSLLTPAERRRGLLVLLMAAAMALLEMGGVASILPFLAVLSEPGIIQENEILAQAYAYGGFTSTHTFLIALGVGAFCMVVLTSLMRAATIYVLNRYAQMRSHSIGYRLLQNYLHQPYHFFLHRNSADLSKTILSESSLLVLNVFRPLTNIVSYSLVVIALALLLFIVDPVVALAVTAGVGLAYALIFWGVRALLRRLGLESVESNRARFTAVNEVLGGIKDVKVLGREMPFLRRFETASVRFARHQATSQTLSQLPKNLIEAVAFGGVLALTLALMTTRQSLGEVLPILGIYVFAGYRLLPAAQQVYGGFAAMRFGNASLDAVFTDLQLKRATSPSQTPGTPAAMRLTSGIRLKDVSYTYPQGDHPVLQELDLEIPVNTTVAFVGSTGSGKTTTVDLILGLLEPTAGNIFIDEEVLTRDNVRAWQRNIGYVPQSIFLGDASVADNIAFGVEPGEVDREAVERAARIANIHDFVVNELTQGYDTVVGERGVRLSGGQRQRIGIARALYHNPDVLVLDEATSALDNATEKAVMEAVRKLSGQKTIVLVAHRLTTVEKADTIFVFERGHVKARGAYAELIRDDPSFRHLAGVPVTQN